MHPDDKHDLPASTTCSNRKAEVSAAVQQHAENKQSPRLLLLRMDVDISKEGMRHGRLCLC